jgi:hypothetical protein
MKSNKKAKAVSERNKRVTEMSVLVQITSSSLTRLAEGMRHGAH